MPFNIAEFRSYVHQRGLSKNNLFEAKIFPPSDVGRGDTLRFFCESVSIPDFGVDTSLIKTHGIGPGTQRPNNSKLGELSCNFYVDGIFEQKELFYKWMQKVVNYNNESYDTRVNNMLPYEFGYLSDYAGSIEIKIFSDNSEDNFYEHRFGNAYPTNIGNIQLSWGNNAELMILPIQFAYNIYSNTTSRRT